MVDDSGLEVIRKAAEEVTPGDKSAYYLLVKIAAEIPGLSAAVWRDGSGVPSNALGNDGDYYLDDTTGDVYTRASSVYSLVGNIKGPAGANGSNGADGAQGPPGPAGGAGGVTLYFDQNTASDIATYFTAQDSPSAGAEAVVNSSLSGTAFSLVASFATPAGSPGVSSLPAGNVDFNVWSVTNRGTYQLKAEVYKRTTGGTETLLRTATSDVLSQQAVAGTVFQLIDSSGYTLDPTDRLVYKLYAARVTGTAPLTVGLYFNGSTHASHVHTTLPVRDICIHGTWSAPDTFLGAAAIPYNCEQSQVISYIKGNGGAVTCTLGDGSSDGDRHVLIGCDNTNTVTLEATDANLTMAANWVGSAGNAIEFVWSLAAGKWIEQSRNTSGILTARSMTFVLGRGVDITTGTSKTNPLIVTKTCTLTKAYIKTTTGPTGADLIVDINKNGSTIWSTQANRLKVVAGATYGTQTSFDTTSFVEGDILTIDVDQVGSTVAGQDATVQLEFE